MPFPEYEWVNQKALFGMNITNPDILKQYTEIDMAHSTIYTQNLEGGWVCRVVKIITPEPDRSLFELILHHNCGYLSPMGNSHESSIITAPFVAIGVLCVDTSLLLLFGPYSEGIRRNLTSIQVPNKGIQSWHRLYSAQLIAKTLERSFLLMVPGL